MARNQFLTGQFPTHPNREFFAALQGIKSGDQGNFRPDQGIPLSSALWAFARPTIRSSRQISNVAEKANGDAARCSKSPKPISSSSFVHEGAPGVPRKSLAELVAANDRAFWASRWRRGSRRARERTGRDGGPRLGPHSVSENHRPYRGGPRVRIHLPPALQRGVGCELDFLNHGRRRPFVCNDMAFGIWVGLSPKETRSCGWD